MKREFMYGDYTIVENNDRVPFTAWLGTEHLGDYHTREGAAARCDRHKRSNAPGTLALLKKSKRIA